MTRTRKVRKNPTVVNMKRKMTWIEGQEIVVADMEWYEWVRYLPRIIIQEFITGYKFPKL